MMAIVQKNNHYLVCSIICHGECEVVFASFLRALTHLSIDILARDKGKSSIQITSLRKFLSANCYSSPRRYQNVCNRGIINFKKNEIFNFKAFSIMDLDEKELNNNDLIKSYKSKVLIKGLYFYNYFAPLFNNKNFDEVLKKRGVSFKGYDRKVEVYERLFTQEKFKNIDDLINFFKLYDDNNIYILLEYLKEYI